MSCERHGGRTHAGLALHTRASSLDGRRHRGRARKRCRDGEGARRPRLTAFPGAEAGRGAAVMGPADGTGAGSAVARPRHRASGPDVAARAAGSSRTRSAHAGVATDTWPVRCAPTSHGQVTGRQGCVSSVVTLRGLLVTETSLSACDCTGKNLLLVIRASLSGVLGNRL